ncbi:TPA: DUF560 domain-containing protein [Mannheimia haemolytica]|uniref:surface lipoprotein assembly modifier n=1 Tax=Mannheimia haemolytica TaxID=75985 RepID=UPI00201C4045|nr:surface lipoprotein assembly modifier [Mannheimia haemolytica]UQX71027.1 surface lipoprotein assembly modifier [Mannheimia haemolytica]HDL5009143.1 DUF560 domain-containing protein [Mannheimia haemolytica]HDL5444274.1 DUF560 domain-containing protein [Mannheimia haemolytica]
MKKIALLALFPMMLFARDPNTTQAYIEHTAQPTTTPQRVKIEKSVPIFNETELRANQLLTEKLLIQAIYSRRLANMEKLTAIYRDFTHIDPVLLRYAQGKIALLKGNYPKAINDFQTILAKQPNLNTVRIELAIALLYDQQLNQAQAQFEKAKSAEHLPPKVHALIEQYQQHLAKKQEWKFSFSANYVRDGNINRTSKQPNIEQTGYVKQPNLLPQTAHGVHYAFGLQRDFNLFDSHYVSFDNQTQGELYWDNHDYDEITNRTLFGYAYKKSDQTTRLLPFYEKRWKHHRSERWTNGIRLEHAQWFSPHWQLATALEYGKKRYFDLPIYNGSYKLASATLLWLRNPQQFFFVGTDFNQDKTQLKQYSSDTKGIRFGWQREWQALELSSRLTLGYTDRRYKDTAILGGKLNLGRIRHDRVQSANLTLWKRDWHWLGLTPKLQFSYAKHRSNLPSLYAYTDKNINLIIESRF